MSAQLGALQDQVNVLCHEVNAMTAAHIGRSTAGQQQQQQQSLPAAGVHQQQAHDSHIDPLLQSTGQGQQQMYSAQQGFTPAAIRQSSPAGRRRSHNQNQRTTFRGPTSVDFNIGVAKNSLHTMGITDANRGDGIQAGSGEGSPSRSDDEEEMQLFRSRHETKDPIWFVSQAEAERLCRVYEEEIWVMCPVLNVGKVLAYARKLYRFINAARRSGLMQQGFRGSDTIDDEDTNTLKLVLASAMTAEAGGRSEQGRKLFESVQPAIDTLLLGSPNVRGVRLLTMTVSLSTSTIRHRKLLTLLGYIRVPSRRRRYCLAHHWSHRSSVH